MQPSHPWVFIREYQTNSHWLPDLENLRMDTCSSSMCPQTALLYSFSSILSSLPSHSLLPFPLLTPLLHSPFPSPPLPLHSPLPPTLPSPPSFPPLSRSPPQWNYTSWNPEDSWLWHSNCGQVAPGSWGRVHVSPHSPGVWLLHGKFREDPSTCYNWAKLFGHQNCLLTLFSGMGVSSSLLLGHKATLPNVTIDYLPLVLGYTVLQWHVPMFCVLLPRWSLPSSWLTWELYLK